jgi:hypothetical protein
MDRLGCVLRVQSGEDQVTGLSRCESGLDGLQIAHLSHEDNVWVLTQHRLERPIERLRVGAHLALVDDAALVPVQELDGVLDGHDVLFARLVDLVDHRRQCGGLARGGSGDQHEPAGFCAQHVQRLGQPQFVYADDGHGNEPERRPQAVPLKECVHPKTGSTGHGVREIYLPVGLQALALILGQDAIDHIPSVVGRQTGVVKRLQVTVDAYGRR